jgi:radical SAM superfamily enzyme YgiQ (UPF0313 family)
MKLRILLVNPWIYDFAAYNLWAQPLGLFKVAEFLSAFDVELSFIDCTDSFGSRQYSTGSYRSEIVPKPSVLMEVPRYYKRYGISIDDFAARLKSKFHCDMVLMTSTMSYWYPGVQQAIEIIREEQGLLPVILGGIYATLYHEHALALSGADFIFRGPLHNGLLFALSTFGFKLKKKREPIPYYRLGLYDRFEYAPLLTSVGCPFRCSYCASSLLANKYERYPNAVIVRDIEELSQMGVHDFAFYDDALLVDPDWNIKPLLRQIIASGHPIRFHTPNGMHAKYIDEELADLMKRAGFRSLRLGLETVDEDLQRVSGGKVCNEDFKKAVILLKKAGFSKRELGVYIMYGLPGQRISGVKESIIFLKGLGVRINLTEFAPIRGTQSWNELIGSGIIKDDLDPLLFNNTIFPLLYSGYDYNSIDAIKLDVKEYNAGI